ELLRRRQEAGKFPLAVLSAGECQSPIPEKPGQGGRAAHFALEFALEAERAGLSPYVLLSGASDGRDGSGEAAGALLTHETLSKARKAGVRPERYLEQFDSHSFFREMGALLPAKNTGTNVSDVRVMLTW
ncbi:MAG: MOFRL family protein, partial [Bdellovibrionota bacterium]